MANPRYSAPEGTSRSSKRLSNTGSMKEKATAAGEQLKSRSRDFLRRVDEADRMVKDAENKLRSSERRLETLIDRAERFINRSAGYSKMAQHWLDDHPEYRERVDQAMHRMQDMRERSAKGLQQAREKPLALLLAGGAGAGIVATAAALRR